MREEIRFDKSNTLEWYWPEQLLLLLLRNKPSAAVAHPRVKTSQVPVVPRPKKSKMRESYLTTR